MAQIGSGLQIVAAGHVTRLKWHRLRRSLADPEFGAAVMAEGFWVGASMELDLQVRGDGGFVVWVQHAFSARLSRCVRVTRDMICDV